MADRSPIEWLLDEEGGKGATWNPTRGCLKVSEGCRNCYAMSMAARWVGPGQPFEGIAKRVNGRPAWTGKVVVVPHKLGEPLGWTRPRRVFVDSMSDLFHERVPVAFIRAVWAVMALRPEHTFLILTKRPGIMRDVAGRLAAESHDDRVHLACMDYPHLAGDMVRARRALERPGAWPPPPVLPNVWLGASAEDQATFDERWPILRETPAAVRFLSLEPLLGRIDLGVGMAPLARPDWAIAGGESGWEARPMHPNWPRLLRDQCAVAGIPFFFKQWGAWGPSLPDPDAGTASRMVAVRESDGALTPWHGVPDVDAQKLLAGFSTRMFFQGKKLAGRILDGRTHDDAPRVPA